jgi:hypothetical protein
LYKGYSDSNPENWVLEYWDETLAPASGGKCCFEENDKINYLFNVYADKSLQTKYKAIENDEHYKREEDESMYVRTLYDENDNDYETFKSFTQDMMGHDGQESCTGRELYFDVIACGRVALGTDEEARLTHKGRTIILFPTGSIKINADTVELKLEKNDDKNSVEFDEVVVVNAK